MAIKKKYKEIMSFDFTTVMQKLANTPTDNRAACHIHKITKEVQKAVETIRKEFQEEIAHKYAQKNEDGSMRRPEGEPNGFIPMEDKLDEFAKAQEDFGNKEATIDWRPLTPSTLKDVKMTAREIDLLGDLFTEEEGPGIPNIAQFKR